jgi:hypothetical protein
LLEMQQLLCSWALLGVCRRSRKEAFTLSNT